MKIKEVEINRKLKKNVKNYMKKVMKRNKNIDFWIIPNKLLNIIKIQNQFLLFYNII